MTLDESASQQPVARAPRWAPWLILAAYLALVLLGSTHHEPWFDEAQSWLLARDASPTSLLFRILRYEGHPPFWHLLLMPLARFGVPYAFLPVFSALIAAIGIALLVFHPRIPLGWKVFVPFTFFPAYQYAVVARSYVLVFPLLMGILWIWPERVRRLRLFTALLCGLSLVSLHGTSLAGGLAAYSLWDPELRSHWKLLPKSSWFELATVVVGLLTFLVVVLLPPNDLAFSGRVHFLPTPMELLRRSGTSFLMGTAGGTTLGLVLLPFVFGWLHQRKCLVLALTLQAALFPICAVYSNPWHQGMFVVALIFVLLLAAQEKAPQASRWSPWLNHAGLAAIVLIGCAQAAGTVRAYAWDLLEPYSGSREIARFLRKPVAQGERVIALGFPCLAVQPYFKRNIFANYHLPDGGAYWTWGRPSPLYYEATHDDISAEIEAWTKVQLAAQPQWVLASYKFQTDLVYLRTIEADGGYQQIIKASGRIIWKQEPDEPDHFVLFKRKKRREK